MNPELEEQARQDFELKKQREELNRQIQRPHEKKRAKIKNWQFVKVGENWWLDGLIYGHPKLFEGTSGHTGYLLRVDFQKKEAETEATIWELI